MKKKEIKKEIKDLKSIIEYNKKLKVESKEIISESKDKIKDLKIQLKQTDKLEVGNWYKSGNNLSYLLYLESIDDTSYSCTVYGFVDDRYYRSTDVNMNGKQTIATDEEVEHALIKEVKRRGFTEGTKFNTSYKKSKMGVNTGIVGCIYYGSFNGVYGLYSNNQWLFNDGEWAEIVGQSELNTIHLKEGEYTEAQLKDVLLVLKNKK